MSGFWGTITIKSSHGMQTLCPPLSLDAVSPVCITLSLLDDFGLVQMANEPTTVDVEMFLTFIYLFILFVLNLLNFIS